MALNEGKRHSPQKPLESGLGTDRLIFKSLRNKVTGELRKPTANFLLDMIKQTKGNNKVLWRCIDQLSGREKSRNGPTELHVNSQNCVAVLSETQTTQRDSQGVANIFNDYFINSVLDLGHSTFEDQSPMVLTNITPSLSFTHTNESNVNKIPSSLSNSSLEHMGP